MVVVIGIAWLLRALGHLLGWSPYLLLFACPLMHLFMHHDQHHHNGEPSTRCEVRRFGPLTK